MAAAASISPPRLAILRALKWRGALPIVDLADEVGISYEATRQHLAQMQLEGWVTTEVKRSPATPGRPRSVYRLTTAGEHLFPKAYDELAIALIDAAGARLGPEAVRALLEEVAERKVAAWEPRLRNLSFEQRVEAMKDVYEADDPFCEVEYDDNGDARLIELNCPYLEVARRRPALCSVTVSVLRKLLGHEVERVERFQEGNGRCVFRVRSDRPVPATAPVFEWEPSLQDIDPERK